MATFIDGIAASENIDSSGERISIAGLDISSLAQDGVFNYEHKNDQPNQVVGKILKAKKIFTDADCDDDRQAYFWQKCQVPFLYVMGELFDDYKESAKEIAGMFRYDADKRGQNERNVMNFSIEGAKIDKQGMDITRSIARKVTITVLPCNKAAVAEMVPSEEKNSKNDLNSLFKTEPKIEIELFKNEGRASFFKPIPASDMNKHAQALGIEPMNKNVVPFKKPMASTPANPAKPAPSAAAGDAPKLPAKTNNPGAVMGTTKSGKSVFTHAKIHEYHGFGKEDHDQAAMMHSNAAQAAKDPKTGAHHLDKMKLHLGAARTAEFKEKRFARGKAQSKEKFENRNVLGKTLDAGMGNAAPGQLTGGAALQGESLDTKKKKPWLKRAEEAYHSWGKKEEFRSFMKDRMPHLAMGEIDAIGKTIALKKSLDAEANLSKLINDSHEKTTKKVVK